MNTPFSRRQFLRKSALAAGASVGAPLLAVPGAALAQRAGPARLAVDPDAAAALGLAPVMINANENPLGP